MNKQKQLKDVASIPSDQLEDWGNVPVPVSETISALRGLKISTNPDGSEAGLWESSPGTWVRQILDSEISTFIKGKAIFTLMMESQLILKLAM